MNTLAEWSLANMTAYGVPMLVFISFIGSLGIPFPITIVIVAAGAFTRSGLLDWRLAMLACMLGASLADNSEYLLGRLAQPWLKQRFSQKSAWKQAQSFVNKQGGKAILLTRFWLTPLAPAVNVIAGSHYPYPRFLFFDMTGQFLWVLLYGGAGYLFAAQWEWVSQEISAVSGWSAAAFLLLLVIYSLAQKRKSHTL